MTYDRLGLDDLKAIEGLLWQLATALDAQRRAVSNLDPEALDRAAEAKRAAVEEIERVGREAPSADGDELVSRVRCDALESVRAAAEHVRINAQANALLLSDAAALVGQALGTRNRAGGYDRRARRITQPRATYAKAV